MQFQPFQQRVIDEKRELDEKLSKLISFIKADTFQELDSINQSLLRRQAGIMQDYSDTLELRIKKFLTTDKRISK
jgi:hypothetical protein